MYKKKLFSKFQKKNSEVKPKKEEIKEYRYLVRKSTRGIYDGEIFTSKEILKKGTVFAIKNRIFKIYFINKITRNISRIIDSNSTLFVKRIN